VRSLRLSVILLAPVMVLLGRSGLAQSYGDQTQALDLGAVEFQELAGDDVAVVGADGYLRNESASPRDFGAPFVLPSGAEVELVCIDYFDPGPTQGVTVGPREIKLVPGGQSPEVMFLPGGVGSNSVGYASSCSDPASFTFRTAVDMNGDGVINAVTYVMRTQLSPGAALGGARVYWRRQVSPPLAPPTFGDVHESDGAWPHVEALAASGITAGCGGANYCPDATLTRRQMAIFLSKALGLHWPD
jgi:hypothetical protein